MTTFALVHGAWHGAACWARVVPEIEQRGHRAVAMDLPCDDPEAGVSAYADAVLAALAGDGDDVVAVGHSLGGLTIPVVAARRPTARLVFVAAVVPVPRRTLADAGASPPVPKAFLGAMVQQGNGTTTFRDDAIAAWFTHDAPAEDAAWLAAGLRPQSFRPSAEPSPLEAWPSVPSSYVVCTCDRIIDPEWQRREARNRLGVEPIEVESGHNPMVSRPGQLADILVSLA